MHKKTNYSDIIDAFENQNVLILGDVMLDSYIWGNVNRLSPEAPVPIVAVERRANLMGGAANVAINIKALGANPILCSFIGSDPRGDEFLEMMEKQNMTDEAVIKSNKRITTTKFRIIGNNYHMLRVDEEITKDINKEEEEKLLQKIKDLIKKHSIGVIIFQDYNKGVLTGRVIKKTLDFAKESGIPVSVDPKKKNFLNYKGVRLFKPNLKELKEGIKTDFDISNTSDLNTHIQAFQEKQEIRNLLLTLSELGVYISTLKSKNNYESYRIPAHFRQIADVSGAGDTVISVASLCLALDVHPFNMAALSNLAGGLVCESVGVVPVNKKNLLKEAKEKL